MGGETVPLHLVAGIFLIRLHQILFTTHTDKNLTNDHTIYQKYIENREILTSDELGLSEWEEEGGHNVPTDDDGVGGGGRRYRRREAARD